MLEFFSKSTRLGFWFCFYFDWQWQHGKQQGGNVLKILGSLINTEAPNCLISPPPALYSFTVKMAAAVYTKREQLQHMMQLNPKKPTNIPGRFSRNRIPVSVDIIYGREISTGINRRTFELYITTRISPMQENYHCK